MRHSQALGETEGEPKISMSGIVESKSPSALRRVGRAPWNKGLKGHVCKSPETCYHKIKPVGMKRPGQSEAMKRAYTEKPGYVDLKGHQKPDLIWFDGKRIVSEDVKSTGTSLIEKEIIVA